MNCMKTIITPIRKKIISMLQENGRSSLLEIASKLGISHTGVKKHLDRLLRNDVIKVKALINPKALNLKLILLLIEAESYEDVKRLTSKFKDCPRIVLLASLIGGYNIVALVVAEDMNVVESITSVCALRTSKGIRRSDVIIVEELVYPKYIPLRLTISKVKDKLPCGFNCCTCSRYIDDKCLGCPLSKCYKGCL